MKSACSLADVVPPAPAPAESSIESGVAATLSAMEEDSMRHVADGVADEIAIAGAATAYGCLQGKAAQGLDDDPFDDDAGSAAAEERTVVADSFEAAADVPSVVVAIVDSRDAASAPCCRIH